LSSSKSEVSLVSSSFLWHDQLSAPVGICNMGRYNNVWSFLARIVICAKCGSTNRVYVDDPKLVPICGRCRAPIRQTCSFRLDESRIARDIQGKPHPPRPVRWWHRIAAEIANIGVHGSVRTAADRKAENDRFAEATRIYRLLCRELDEVNAEEQRRAREREAEQAQVRLERARAAEIEAERRTQAWMEEVRKQQEWERRECVVRVLKRFETVHYLSGRDFELFLGEAFELIGYVVEVTQESCDQGVDLILTAPAGRRIAVQAKNYSQPAGHSAIQEAYTGIKLHECDVGVVIARSGFTRAAKNAAAKTGIYLWTLEDVRRLLRDRRPMNL